MTDRFIVIAGGPGAGKTTLIDALRAIGFAGSDDAARSILQQFAQLGRPDPRGSQAHQFVELILSWELRSYQIAGSQVGPVFFDRGLPDVAHWAQEFGGDLATGADAAARLCRYRPTVFLAPFWLEIYEPDAERIHSIDHAVRVERLAREAYQSYGYEVVELPRDTVEARVRFVLDTCGLHPAAQPQS